jgi:putative hydrolase of the HAD superfamily
MDRVTPLRAVLFDLGHTVWDYAPTEHSRRIAALRLHERLIEELADDTPHPRQLERAFLRQLERAVAEWYGDATTLVQPTSDVFVRRALGTLEFSASERLVADVTEIIFGTELDVPVVSAASLSAIAELHTGGILMGCITNTILLPVAIEELLRRLGLVRYFEAVVVSSGAGFRKPHASLFERALAELGVTANETLFVGDRLLDDVSGAKALGMRAALTQEFRQEAVEDAVAEPDFMLPRLSDLPAVLRTAGAI